MANLKEIRNRIASVNSTQKITSAMKLVSASKLRRAQTAIIGLRPYANKLNEIMQNLSDNLEETTGFPLLEVREPKNVVLIVFTSNKGLCGSFNANMIKETERIIHEQYPDQVNNKNLKLICIGRKGHEQLSRNYDVMLYNETLIDNPSFHELAAITDDLITDFLDYKVDKVEIIYNQFINPATQKITATTLLPFQELSSQSPCEKKLPVDYIFEPTKEELLESIIPKSLRIKMYSSLIDSIASEHGARMTSMAKATDNATEMLKDLRLKYNNARQSAITTELLEIISGANALDG